MPPRARGAAQTWDVVVLGGGPAGENVAQYAIQGSSRTAVIVEPELVGGECSYWACMPSKVLLRSVELLDAGRAVPGVAESVSGPLDVAAILARRDAFTNHHDDSGQVKWARGARDRRGAGPGPSGRREDRRGHRRRRRRRRAPGPRGRGDRHREHGRGPAGRRPARGLPWTSRDVTNMREVPRRVAVIGGGVVACESATWLKGLGVEEVTVIERGPSLLARQEPFAVDDHRRRSSASAGSRCWSNTELQSVRRPAAQDNGVGRIHGGPATITADGATFEVDEIVVAAGRTPATADIGLETVGLDAERSTGTSTPTTTWP